MDFLIVSYAVSDIVELDPLLVFDGDATAPLPVPAMPVGVEVAADFDVDLGFLFMLLAFVEAVDVFTFEEAVLDVFTFEEAVLDEDDVELFDSFS